MKHQWCKTTAISQIPHCLACGEVMSASTVKDPDEGCDPGAIPAVMWRALQIGNYSSAPPGAPTEGLSVVPLFGEPKALACECGVAKVGGIHSSWCPVATP